MSEPDLYSCKREVSLEDAREMTMDVGDPEEGRAYVTNAPFGFHVRVSKTSEEWSVVPEDKDAPGETVSEFHRLWNTEAYAFDEYLYDDMTYIFLVCSEILRGQAKEGTFNVPEEKIMLAAAFMNPTTSNANHKLVYPGPGVFYRKPHPQSVPGGTTTVASQVPLNIFNNQHMVSMLESATTDTTGYHVTHIVDGQVRDRFKVLHPSN